jgi:murein DD-endopeptidase MepM/ murein hydrolase activator NlpD
VKKIVLHAFMFFCSAAHCASFLTAESFPTTFSDLSFTERMAVLKEGYEPYEITFDANGRCVSGCAFSGMTIEDTKTYYQRQADIAAARAQTLMTQHPEWTQQPSAVIIQSSEPVRQEPVVNNNFPTVPTQSQPSTVNSQDSNIPTCISRIETINPAQTVPNGWPTKSRPRITSQYGPRNIANGSSVHMGMDFGTTDGTPVFSTIAGTAVNVVHSPNGSCGNYVKIQNTDGFAIRFCHLQSIDVKQGEKIAAGCQIGKSGHSGVGRAGKPYPSHLHYEIFNSENRQINPQSPRDYLGK